MRLHFFGQPRLASAPGARALLAPPTKPVALLAVVALTDAGDPVSRDAAASLIWPRLHKGARSGRLRQLLALTRRTFGAEVFEGAGPNHVGLARDRVWCDAWRLAQAFEEGAYEEATMLYRGPVLQGWDGSSGAAWEEWREAKDASLRQLAAEAAWRASREARDNGETRRAIELARRAVSLDPDNERGVRELMRLLQASGDRAGALAEYERLARRMRSAWGASPAPETTAMIAPPPA
jgi:DNA-binding SARP family transcriptional activator